MSVIESTHTVMHPEAAAWLVDQLDRDEAADFLGGLTEVVETLTKLVRIVEVDGLDTARGEADRAFRQMSDYLESWRLSVVLAADPEWQRQIAESDAVWAAEGDTHPSVTAEEIRQSLGA